MNDITSRIKTVSVNRINVNPIITNFADQYKDYDASDSKKKGLFYTAIAVLIVYMNTISQRGKAEFARLEEKANVSRDCQEQANAVDAAIAECNKANNANTAEHELPDSAIEFLRAINLEINGSNIDKYLKDHGTGTGNKKLDKGELTAVRAALETHASRASDFVSQTQLKIQNTMQSYNITSSMISQLQQMLAEINKMIVQGIR